MSGASLPLQGMSDIVSPEVSLWQRLETTARAVLARYAFTEIRTPVLEKIEVFTHSLGDTTDIVQKEMYAFADRGGRNITLRPEGTAGVMRWVAGAGQESADARLYYIGPMFRAERPQAGRKRQFHQLGVEAIGAANALQDAEVIEMQHRLLTEWGVKDAVFQLNTRGAPEEMESVRAGLRDELRPRLAALCPDCQRRFEQNVLRILDCKVPACRAIALEAPRMIDFMAPASREYFQSVLSALRQLGVPAEHNPMLVRGLDYYQHTVWEVTSASLGAQDALSGGGRYRVNAGGRAIDGVGFGIGLERVITALGLSGAEVAGLVPRPAVYLAAQNADALGSNQLLARDLRSAGVSCVASFEARSLKSQFKSADRAGVRFTVVRGESELAAGTCQVKEMATGAQVQVPLGEVASWLAARL
ncbi:MAG: histidine--tRNA ligase [Kiritimatiellia bacterium]